MEQPRRLDPVSRRCHRPLAGRVCAGPAQAARLRAGDIPVIDEAGMLDQDTARALLTIADEAPM